MPFDARQRFSVRMNSTPPTQYRQEIIPSTTDSTTESFRFQIPTEAVWQRFSQFLWSTDHVTGSPLRANQEWRHPLCLRPRQDGRSCSLLYWPSCAETADKSAVVIGLTIVDVLTGQPSIFFPLHLHIACFFVSRRNDSSGRENQRKKNRKRKICVKMYCWWHKEAQ